MLFFSYIIWMKLSHPFGLSEGVYALFLLMLVAAWVVNIPSLFSSILVTEFGIEMKGLLGRKRRFRWDEIKAVTASTFPGRSGLTSIISNSGEKVMLMGSMTGYSELLELVLSKAPNVKNELPNDSWVSHFGFRTALVVNHFWGFRCVCFY